VKIWAFVLTVIFTLFTSGELVYPQEKAKMVPEISLPSQVEGWKSEEKDAEYTSKSLFDYIDGAAELYRTYGFRHLRVRRLEKEKQPPIVIELYEMGSSEDAFGVFSFERQDEPAGIGQGSEFGGGLLRFWKERYFVSIYADGEGVPDSTLIQVGKATAKGIPSDGGEPMVISLIPGTERGLVGKSVRYLKSHVLLNQRFFVSHQNILNLNRDSEAVLAQYVRGGQKVHFLLLGYPDADKALEAYRGFVAAYLPDGRADGRADAGAESRIRTEDQKWTIARRWNEFVLIVFGSPTEDDADLLIKGTEQKLSGTK
jgi:hypothetical protein